MLLRAVSLFLSFTTVCRCDDTRQQVYRGNPISMDQYLWFSAIFEVSQEELFLCSGALISSRHVITADHCLDDRVISSLLVRVGYFCPRADNCARQNQNRKVIEHRRDPSLGDVAILVLSSKVGSIFAPAVPDVASPSYLSLIEGGGMVMVGAGRDGTSEEVARRTETLELKLKHTNFKKCRNAINNKAVRRRVVSKATICSTSDQGKPCDGDSGSATLVEGADSGGDVIVAIHNYGPTDCSGADDEVLFGHVSVSAVAEFVISIVCVGDKKETWCPSTPAPAPLDAAACMEVCAPFASSSCPPTPVAPTPDVPVLKGDSLQATLLHDLTNHAADVFAVAFDATSTRVASSDRQKTVHVWDLSTGRSPQLTSTFRLDDVIPHSLAFNPAGTILAVDNGNDVALLDVQNTNNANEPRKLQGHTDKVGGVAWHPNGRMLASGAHDEMVKLWDVATGNVLQTFQGHSADVWSVSFDPQGRFLASSSEDATIRFWDLSTLSHERTLRGHTGFVYSVAFSPDGTKLASGSFDDTVRVWRATDGAPLGLSSVGSAVNSVAWSPDGQFLVSGSDDGVVRIWDASDDGGEALLEMKGHSLEVLSVAWSGNGKWIASGSFDDTVKVWEITSD